MSSIGRPGICTNFIISAKHKFSTSSASFKSHYDTLGIHPKSTQNDIKSAYYELTKIYHPDKNKSEGAKAKFRDITTAYEILGNYKSRKMYDRGMRPGDRPIDNRDPEEKRKEDAQTRFYRSRMTRSRVPAPDGRSPIYNFDEWARAHYGNILNENIRARETWQLKHRYNEEQKQQMEESKVWFPVVGLLLLFTTTMYTAFRENSIDTNRIMDKTRVQTSGDSKESSRATVE